VEVSGQTWLYADPHFYHTNIVKFLRGDGTPLRPWDDAAVMSEEMIEMYNDTVDDQDRVYFLGDVAMTRRALDRCLPRLKGRKVLVKGNHDLDKLSYYAQYFDDIRACVQKKGFILTHIPIHPGSLGRWQFNIHGHLHSNVVRLGNNFTDEYSAEMDQLPVDPRYACVSVEHTGYKPILLDEVLKRKPE
jgi:calcineurin-like phosphoesterase family protein